MPTAKSAAKPTKSAKPTVKSSAKTTPAVTKKTPTAKKTPAKPAAKPAAKPTAKPTAKPAVKSAAKAAPKSAAKAAPKSVAKPAAKSSGKTASTARNAQTPKTAAQASRASSSPASKTAAKKLAELKPAKTAAAAPAKKVAPAARPVAEAGADKRGRKGKDLAKAPPEEDLSDIEAEFAEDPAAEAAEKAKPLRMKISKAKERALMKEFGLDEAVLSEEDMLKRRQRLKTLIKLGKTRGYLTHGEISDHLPDKLVDAETLEVVVNMLNDMGVAVYEQAPDAETLLLNNTGPTVATEEEAEEEAEAALSTVDSEFGRTTDPVRMYMREMGTVELLTREGEIEIAKRIEGGLQRMMEAISESPATIAEILKMAEEIREDKIVISNVVDGFTDPNEADDYVAEEDFDEFDDEDDDDGKGGSKALTKKLEEMKKEALVRFERISGHFDAVRRIYGKEGYGSPAYMKAQRSLSEELMTVRFTAKTIERLCDMLREQVGTVRKVERDLRRIIVDKCGMPQETFIKDFPPNLLNPKWVEKQAAAGKPWSAVLGRNIPAVQELQAKLAQLQASVVVPLDQLKDISKRMNEGERSSRDAKKEMIEANLRPVSYTHLTLPTKA